MDVDLPEGVAQRVQVDGPGVVHVETGGFPVRDDEARVTDRTVRGSAQSDDHDVEIALGTADGVLDGVFRLEELVEAELLEFTLEVRHRVIGEQDCGVLVDVRDQILRIEVVLVQVRDVEVVAIAQRVPVQLCVVGERHPGRKIRRGHPWITQDGSGLGLDVKSCVADAGDLHCNLRNRTAGQLSIVGAIRAKSRSRRRPVVTSCTSEVESGL